MSGDLEPVPDGQGTNKVLSHQRILVIMACIGLAATAISLAYISFGFAAGILIGFALAFVNYYWLQLTLKQIFASAAAGERPKMLVGKYFLRYLILGFIVAALYISRAVPVGAVVFGLAGFGLAVVAEGFIRIFSNIFSKKEIQ